MRAKQLINESNTTQGLEKVWMGFGAFSAFCWFCDFLFPINTLDRPHRDKTKAHFVPDQFFFCDPVVIESFCYRMRSNQLINESNTIGRLRKIWTGFDQSNSPHLLHFPFLVSICLLLLDIGFGTAYTTTFPSKFFKGFLFIIALVFISESFLGHVLKLKN